MAWRSSSKSSRSSRLESLKAFFSCQDLQDSKNASKIFFEVFENIECLEDLLQSLENLQGLKAFVSCQHVQDSKNASKIFKVFLIFKAWKFFWVVTIFKIQISVKLLFSKIKLLKPLLLLSSLRLQKLLECKTNCSTPWLSSSLRFKLVPSFFYLRSFMSKPLLAFS